MTTGPRSEERGDENVFGFPDVIGAASTGPRSEERGDIANAMRRLRR